ncbi:M17 family metallopeptidase [Sanguibacter sp. HDW7]|uniref:leucyl aminopeptidase family protein n=1 Tax=Sanguibacter sp. HDW7 TaxID=2714931 RepID=UPI00140CFD1F|nr:leucyl aminopeptidase [Sanguibacter sp. HDW7]QIK82455.1 leucyl aminopeptidase [Sanguibacter sp. HDW7]
MTRIRPTLPGLDALDSIRVWSGPATTDTDVVGFATTPDGDLPAELGLDHDALARAGYESKPSTTLRVPRTGGPDLVAVGVGAPTELTLDLLRDAAAALVRAAGRGTNLGLRVDPTTLDAAGLDRADALCVLAEGALLATYSYTGLVREPRTSTVESVTFDLGRTDDADAEVLADVKIAVRATVVARDLTNTPPGHLTATGIADIAVELGTRFGFDVEIADRAQLVELGCGGLLGVNQGSAQEPRMVTLRYRPDGTPSGRLGLVGKGIMYDSGGISLKPSDPMHLLMKMDMGGAAAVLGAFTGLRDAGVRAEVVGRLMCTDNMPSGTAYKLGDVLTARDGTTIEVRNTDAEGRLVMCDGFALAVEDEVDAIVDVATLTGAALISLGTEVAALLGNDDRVVALAEDAARTTGEKAWRLPLERAYRPQLDSQVADISNLGGPFAGTITAALFLDHFTAGTPWAHLDIAGTMQVEKDTAWRSRGATGYGARLLLDLAKRFTAPRA